MVEMPWGFMNFSIPGFPNHQQHGWNKVSIPSRELTYPPKLHFADDFPFPQVGYVNSLEGIPTKGACTFIIYIYMFTITIIAISLFHIYIYIYCVLLTIIITEYFNVH